MSCAWPSLLVHAPSGSWRSLSPHADLVQMIEKVLRVLIDPIGPGPFQLVLPVAAGEQADAEGAGPARRQQVPDAVADDDRIADVDVETLCPREEEVRVGLC